MLYLIRSGDGRLYTGISTDVKRRFSEHQNKDNRNKGAKALRGKAPLSLVYEIAVGNRSEASKLEYRIKQLNKARKEEMIQLDVGLDELKAWIEKNETNKQK